MASHIMQYHGFLQGFRELDLPLKEFDLPLKSPLVHLVQTRFAKGKDLCLLQVVFQFIQGFIHLKISLIQCPRVNAVTVKTFLGT